MSLATAACIEDLRRLAHRRLPAMLSGFVDSGASSESTLAANIRDFERWSLNQRVLVDISGRSLATNFLGADRPLPFMLAPLGLTGVLWPRGEAAAARAAAAAGIPYCLSTASICSLEEVVAAAATPGTVCYQLYVMKDRALTERMIQRAEAAGVDTLFLTVDTIIGGIREADIRSGFRTADRPSLRAALDMARHLGWARGMLRNPRPRLGNLSEWGEFNGLMAQAAALVRQLDPTLSWADLAWLRDRWKGRLVIKGILSVDDAQRAVDAGADAIVVSNHGGRQLDGARSSIAVLPEVAAAVGGRTEILFDSGIRRGAQIVKALALGADACMLGRAFVYGLGAAGEAGVAKAIELIRNEMDITLALMGVTSIAELKGNGRVLVREESALRN